jgi:hypothetical protein
MPYTDWTSIFDTDIPNKKDLSIIEFGLGEGTEYLLKNFKFVYSHELIGTRQWYDYTVEKFSKYKNWEHELILFNEVGFQDYNPNLPEVILNHIVDLFETYKFDVVFVDGDYHVRGDIVNFILNKFQPKYVAIHDVNFAFLADGYDRINLPSNYISTTSTIGEGTTIFKKTN